MLRRPQAANEVLARLHEVSNCGLVVICKALPGCLVSVHIELRREGVLDLQITSADQHALLLSRLERGHMSWNLEDFTDSPPVERNSLAVEAT